MVLDWEPIKGAKSYQIQISTDPCSRATPSSTRWPRCTAPATRRPKTLNNDQYFWRIRPTDAAGFQPDWSSRPVWRFKRTWPDQPTLLYPENNATNVQNPFYFQWTPVKHASSYVVQISSGARFPTPAPFPRAAARRCTRLWCTATTSATAGRTEPGTYSWRVTARDEFSNESR